MFTLAWSGNSEVIIKAENITRLNFLNIEKLKNRVFQVYEKFYRVIYLDLKNIKFIDSKAFEGLLYLNTQACQYGVDFICCNVSAELQELFDLVCKEYKIELSTRKDLKLHLLTSISA